MLAAAGLLNLRRSWSPTVRCFVSAGTGFLLGITTGAVEAATHIKLARANLSRFFSFGGYGSDSATAAS